MKETKGMHHTHEGDPLNYGKEMCNPKARPEAEVGKGDTETYPNFSGKGGGKKERGEKY